MQTNELYQLAAVAFCLLLAWVRLFDFIAVSHPVMDFSMTLIDAVWQMLLIPNSCLSTSIVQYVPPKLFSLSKLAGALAFPKAYLLPLGMKISPGIPAILMFGVNSLRSIGSLYHILLLAWGITVFIIVPVALSLVFVIISIHTITYNINSVKADVMSLYLPVQWLSWIESWTGLISCWRYDIHHRFCSPYFGAGAILHPFRYFCVMIWLYWVLFFFIALCCQFKNVDHFVWTYQFAHKGTSAVSY